MSIENKQELPAVVLRKILPFLGTKDIKNVGIAVEQSPTLYNEFSCFTKKHARETYPESRLICPYCLIAGGYVNPWQKLRTRIFGNDQRIHHSASESLAMFKLGPKMLIETQNLAQITAPIHRSSAFRPNPADPKMRFRNYMDKRANEGVKNGQTAKEAINALEDLKLFTSAKDLVQHVEDTHDPHGKNWRKIPTGSKRRAKQAKNEFIRAVEIDELGSLLDNKKYRDSIHHQSPRKNVLIKQAIVVGILNNKRRFPQPRTGIFLNTPLSFADNDLSQNYHRTLALAYLIEDNLNYSNKQFKVLDPKLHKLWALRNFLACMCEVFESCEFIDLDHADVNRFGMYNAIKVILDHVIKLPY